MKRFLLFLTLALVVLLPAKAVLGQHECTYDANNSNTSFTTTTGNISLVFAKANGGTKPNNAFDGHFRFYAGNTLTVTPPTGEKLFKVEIQTTQNLNDGSTAYADGVKQNFQIKGTATWFNGNGADKLVITNGGTSSHAKITKIVVTLLNKDEDEGKVYWTDYSYTDADGYANKVTTATAEAGENASIHPYDTSTHGAPADATYTSSSTAVATVDADGSVTAVAPGTTTLTIKASDGRTAHAR